MIKAIIYDFDGTLADTLRIHFDEYSFTLLKFKIKASRDEIVAKCFNKSDNEVAKNFNIKDTKLFSKYYRRQVSQLFRNIKLYPGVISTFREISKLNLPIGIGTSRNREDIAPQLNKLQLRNFCKVIVTHDEVLKKKINIFIEVCKRLKVKPEETVIVGDAETDLESANRLKAKSVLFYPKQHHKYYKLEDLKRLKPNFIIENHNEIIRIINLSGPSARG